MAKETEKKSVFDTIDVQIQHQGSEIILPGEPKDMSLDDAIKQLRRKKEELETEVAVYEPVDAFPWDGANAFMLAMREKYGWTQAVPKQSFFGPIPPTVVKIDIGPHVEDTASIIWGSFQLPNIEATLETAFDWKDNRPIFCIRGKTKRKHHPAIAELATRTRQLVRERSIYKGKAIRLKCEDDGQLNVDEPPSFMNVDEIKPEELIFSRNTEDLVETNVLTPIKKTELCKRLKIPLARGILLEGPFGVGKTLLAGVTAKVCQDNGWTFMVIDQVAALSTAIDFARLYAPCVVFSEDIDRVLKGDRTAEMDAILNTVDGVQSKSDSIITILTTNDVEAINQAMLRPGRLDAVISIKAPDAEAAERLVRLYGRGLIEPTERLTKAGKALEGQIPAVIREVVERSKLGALMRANSEEDIRKIKLIDEDLETQAKGMQDHLDLLNKDRTKVPTPEEAVGNAMRDIMVKSVPGSMNGMASNIRASAKVVTDGVKQMRGTYDDLRQRVDGLHGKVDQIAKQL